jgi:hypothetical protein
MNEAELPHCQWCGEIADEPHDGFFFEPDDDSFSEAESGWYCSVACVISAS